MGFAYGLFVAGAMIAVWTWYTGYAGDISVYQIVHQDFIVLFAGACLLAFLIKREPVFDLRVGAAEARTTALITAVLTLVAGYAGSYFIALNFPLSMDEFMVLFDARIFLGGHIFAPLPPDWQGLAKALQPTFLFDTEAPYLASNYLPVNAALHAAMSFIDSALTAPLLAALSLLLLFDIARKLWPRRPDAAFVAVVLLATSAQFLLTAMTPYAMTAHLAFNLLWLWLFLRNTPISHGAALLVGFAATGLHQIVFHPIFVAPFILSLWLGRRWSLAGAYTVGYGAICLFWILYRSLVLPDIAPGGENGVAAFAANVGKLVMLDWAPLIFFMPRNLARLISWQNPFTLVLICVAFTQLRRWAFPLPQLLAGIVLTLVLSVLLMPYQGHGWGYRYLHGFLGSFSLIAAFAWVQLTGAEAARMRGALAVCTTFALICLPVRAWQMRAFTEPYARASAAIQSADADIVFVDPSNGWFANDLVRNDPYLRNRPKVLVLNRLEQSDVARLCTGRKTLLFHGSHARAFGIRTSEHFSFPNLKLRAYMVARGCGTPMGLPQ